MTTKIRIDDLHQIELDDSDKNMIATAINFFGSGDHPMATPSNLADFDLDYLLDCLDKGIQSTKTEELQDQVRDLWCGIHMAKEESEDSINDDDGMSHNEFEAIMARISRNCTLVHRAETDTFYNVSPASAKLLRQVERMLDEAADSMGDQS